MRRQPKVYLVYLVLAFLALFGCQNCQASEVVESREVTEAKKYYYECSDMKYTATVCYGDTICIWKDENGNDVYDFPLNAKGDCQEGAEKVTIASRKQLRYFAARIAESSVPPCSSSACITLVIYEINRSESSKCCTITMLRDCEHPK